MKQRGVFLIGLIIITIYYFLFPRGSGRELVISPDSLTSLTPSKTSVSPAPGRTLAIRSGSRAGFVDPDHKIVSLYSSEKMAVDDQWLAISRDGGLDILESDGRLISRISQDAYPISRNGNLYLYRDEYGILSKVDPGNGRILWKKEYISPITVIDGRENRTLVGFLDGRVQLISNDGTILLEYSPGGSRVEVIYGAALSSDGSKIGLISGLDPQRFILLEERKNGYRPVAHHNTETDFRRPVPIGFVRNDRQILYESKDSVASVELNNYEVRPMTLPGRLTGWLDDVIDETLVLLGRNNDQIVLKILSGNDLTFFEGNLPSDTVGILSDRNFAIIVGSDSLAALEFSVQ
jgi:hypothetical protein